MSTSKYLCLTSTFAGVEKYAVKNTSSIGMHLFCGILLDSHLRDFKTKLNKKRYKCTLACHKFCCKIHFTNFTKKYSTRLCTLTDKLTNRLADLLPRWAAGQKGVKAVFMKSALIGYLHWPPTPDHSDHSLTPGRRHSAAIFRFSNLPVLCVALSLRIKFAFN